jgi:hypothetical protein
MNTLWQIIGKKTDPLPLTGWQDTEPGDREICIQFPDEGCIVFNYHWSADVSYGQKSNDPLVPDDPDILICTSFYISSVYNYDVEGTELPVRVTPEITQLLIQWVKDNNILNVDEYDL